MQIRLLIFCNKKLFTVIFFKQNFPSIFYFYYQKLGLPFLFCLIDIKSCALLTKISHQARRFCLYGIFFISLTGISLQQSEISVGGPARFII